MCGGHLLGLISVGLAVGRLPARPVQRPRHNTKTYNTNNIRSWAGLHFKVPGRFSVPDLWSNDSKVNVETTKGVFRYL